MGYQREQVWYNGIKQPAISGSEANEDVLGIQGQLVSILTLRDSRLTSL
jgi:hypothetical protein